MNEEVAALLGGRAAPLGLLELAGVLGGLCWLESSAHRALGEISTTEDVSDSLVVWASSSSMAHAWRARELQVLLPASSTLPDNESLIVAPSKDLEQWLVELRRLSLQGSGQALSSLVGWYETLESAYRRRMDPRHEAADEHLRKSLSRLVASVASCIDDLRRRILAVA